MTSVSMYSIVGLVDWQIGSKSVTPASYRPRYCLNRMKFLSFLLDTLKQEDGLCCSSSAIQTRLDPSSLLEERSETPIVFCCFFCVVGYRPNWGKRPRYIETLKQPKQFPLAVFSHKF